jgi:adenylate cyclase
MLRTLIRLGISAFVFIVFLVHTAGLAGFGLLTTLENLTYDARILLTMPRTIDPHVVVVDIDEKTMAAEGQWPWPRARLAELVAQLFDKYHVKVLGFDEVFPEPDKTSGFEALDKLAAGELAGVSAFKDRLPELKSKLDNDRIFADSLKHRNVVLGYVFQPETREGSTRFRTRLGPAVMDEKEASLYTAVAFPVRPAYVANLEQLQEAAPYGGFFDMDATLDDDGSVRRAPLLERFGKEVYPSLSLAVLRVALDNAPVSLEFDPPSARASLNLERLRVGDRTASIDERVAVMVPYRGHSPSFRYVSATDVIHGTVDKGEQLNGAIALLGTTAAGLKDLRNTPVGAAYPGVEVHANIISGFLDGRIKQKAPYYIGIEAVMLFVIAFGLALLFPVMSPIGGATVTVGILAAVTGLAFALWQYGNFVMPLGVPVVFTLAIYLTQQLYGFLIEARRSRDISRRFGEYVPPEIVEEMAANPESVSMEGQTRDMTVLFSDVRGFTNVSEQLEAKELAELMNQFLTPLTRVIQKHRGTIDKYMGDAIMAFWGAPLADPKHAENALAAALEFPKAIRALDEGFAKRNWPALHIGVGLCSGPMRVGNMGSEFRRAYTVMGDPVNLGSRVEGLTKTYGATIICTETTRNVGPGDWSFRELDLVRVKGKDEPVAIYEPMGPKEALDPDLRQDVARHRGALKLYRAQDWERAEQEFFTLSRGKHPHAAYELFLERIAHYRKNPPGEKWDGAWTFETK